MKTQFVFLIYQIFAIYANPNCPESKVINCQREKPTFGDENHSVTCECYGDHSNVTLGKNEPIFCKLHPLLTKKITNVKFKSCKFWTIEKVFLDPGFKNIKEVNFQGYL